MRATILLISHLSAKSPRDDFGPGPPLQAINHVVVTKLRWGWEKKKMEFPKKVQGGKQQGRDHWCFLSIPINLSTATLRKERVWINGVLGLGTWKERATEKNHITRRSKHPYVRETRPTAR